jgi:hypothetical protein
VTPDEYVEALPDDQVLQVVERLREAFSGAYRADQHSEATHYLFLLAGHAANEVMRRQGVAIGGELAEVQP